jgi:hypothetical protein
MRLAAALAITLGAFALSPVFAASAEPAETVPHHYRHHHHTHHGAGRAAPAIVAPEAVAPLTLGVTPHGETDGLSRDEDDCDMGCVGGNPN